MTLAKSASFIVMYRISPLGIVPTMRERERERERDRDRERERELDLEMRVDLFYLMVW